MRRIPLILLLALVPGPLAPAPAAAQWLNPVVGGAVGAAGGAVVTLSVVVARARFQKRYLDSVEDLVHWQSTPMVAAPLVGIAFGVAGRDPLVNSIIGATSGMVVGAAAGTALGWLLSSEQEWPWAGGVIGAGLGITVGGLVGGLLRSWDGGGGPAAGEEPAATRIDVRIPL